MGFEPTTFYVTGFYVTGMRALRCSTKTYEKVAFAYENLSTKKARCGM